MTIAPERKQKIKEYLKKNECSPSLSGYNILINAINIAADNPTDQCQDIFLKYTDAQLREDTGVGIPKTKSRPKDGFWRAAYRAARYCFMNSAGRDDYKGIYEFIRVGAEEVE